LKMLSRWRDRCRSRGRSPKLPHWLGGAGFHRDGSARRAGLCGVDHRLLKNALQQFGIESKRRDAAHNCDRRRCRTPRARQRHGANPAFCAGRLGRPAVGAGGQNCRKRVISELQRSTSEAMKPAISLRHLVFRCQAVGEHFRRSANGAERVAQLMGEAGGELAERGQAVGAAASLPRLAGAGDWLRRAGRPWRAICESGSAGPRPPSWPVADHGNSTRRGTGLTVTRTDLAPKPEKPVTAARPARRTAWFPSRPNMCRRNYRQQQDRANTRY